MAAKPLLRCPKCSRKISNRIECRNCGLIFDKYFKAEAQRRAAEQAKAARKAKVKQVVSIGIMVLLIASLGGAIFYYQKNKKASAPSLTASTANQLSDNRDLNTSDQTESGPVDSVKQATIIVTAPWGEGTGFFVAENLVLTNKTNVHLDRSQHDENRAAFEGFKSKVSSEYSKLMALKEQYETMPDGPNKEQLQEIITDGESQYTRALEQQARLEKVVLEGDQLLENQVISIKLPDGSEKEVDSVQLSGTQNLALLTVSGVSIPHILLPPEGQPFNEGDEANLVGPGNILVSGSFTGIYRGESGTDYYLQTDKPISPRNSGGPMVDADGFLRGILTDAATHPEGTSLAIPIEAVRGEFSF